MTEKESVESPLSLDSTEHACEGSKSNAPYGFKVDSNATTMAENAPSGSYSIYSATAGIRAANGMVFCPWCGEFLLDKAEKGIKT